MDESRNDLATVPSGGDGERLVTVARFLEPVKVQMAKGLLESLGIECFVQGENANAMLALAFLVLQRRRLGGKRAGDDRARGAGPAGPPAGGARLGRGRDPGLVGLASGAESPSVGEPSQATARRTATTPAK